MVGMFEEGTHRRASEPLLLAGGLVLAAALHMSCSGERDDPDYNGSSSSGSSSSSSGTDPGPPTSDTGKWVEELLLGVTVGNDIEVVHRWNHSPVVGVVGSSNLGAPGDALDSAVQALNAAIAASGIVMSVDASSADPDIALIVGSEAELDAAKEQAGIAGYGGSAWAWWGTDHALINVLVFVLEGDESELVLTEGLSRSLGVLQSSDIFADSLFTTPYTGFETRDATLLELLYTQLSPGDTRIDLRIAFNDWWPDP